MILGTCLCGGRYGDRIAIVAENHLTTTSYALGFDSCNDEPRWCFVINLPTAGAFYSPNAVFLLVVLFRNQILALPVTPTYSLIVLTP